VRLPWSAYGGQTICLTQGKTEVRVVTPLDVGVDC